MLKKIGIALAIPVIAVLLLVAYVALRHLVLWAPTEPVVFPSNGIELAGDLVKPAAEGVFPAVVLLHGSGPEPRADLPQHAVINALVRAGFAVLLYDKRGVGESGGDFEPATYGDFINDGVAAVTYLTKRADVDADRIGLYAVSEGAWLAPEIAVRTERIRFIFNKVGAPMSVAETVQWEMRNDYAAAGIGEAEVAQLIPSALRRWRYYEAAAADAGLATAPERDAINDELERLRKEIPLAEPFLPEQVLPYEAQRYAEIAADLFYDPTPYLLQLDIPLYYAYGADDINVPTEQSVAVLESLRTEHGKDITYIVYPGLGHSLASPKGFFNVGYPGGYLDTLGEWAAQAGER